MSSTNRTEIQVARDTEFTDIVYNEVPLEEAPYKTEHQFDRVDLPWACDLYMRVRHWHAGAQKYTEWSEVVSFRIKTPASIIGVCLDPESKTFKNIDGAGNLVSDFDYTTHPIYSGITMVSSGESEGAMTLTKIPMCYVHTSASGPEGSYAQGKKCWWLSDLVAKDFRPHPAFKRNAGDIAANSCYLGTYLCSELILADGTSAVVSRKNMEVLTGMTKAEAVTMAEDRGDAYRLLDIWDLSLIKLLALIAKGSADSQTVWGRNTTEYAPRTGTTGCSIRFKGTVDDPLVLLADLWQNYWYYVDRVQIMSGVYVLMSPSDESSAVLIAPEGTVGKATPPETSGWIVDIADAPMYIGADLHNLQELMLPSVVSTERTDSAFDDYHSASSGSPHVIAGCSKNYSTVESIGYWSVYGTSCPRREEVVATGQINCIQSEQLCDEVQCRYMIDTAINADWAEKAGLFSTCAVSLPSAFVGMRLAKQ